MKINLKIILCIITVMVFFSCRKKVHKVNSNFVGEWTNSPAILEDEYNLTIKENSDATFRKKTILSDRSFHGYARIGDGVLSVGGIHKFKIIIEPMLKDRSFAVLFGNKTYHWFMTLQTPTFYGHDKVTLFKE